MEFLVKRALLAAGLTLGALLALPAMAKEGDTFRPFVSLGYFYDSNLFRLDQGEPILEGGVLNTDPQRSDQYGVLSAGVNVDWKPGRQQVIANATKSLIRYDHYGSLDFDGDDLQATWNWRLGNRLSGDLGAARSTTQSSFEDIRAVNNEVDRERRFGRAEWEFHPRWRIGGGVEDVDNTNSALSQISQDFQLQAYDVVLGYRTPKGSNLRAQVRAIDADFPNPQIFFVCDLPPCPPSPLVLKVADNSYEQTEYNLLGDWRVTGKLTLRGRAGWVDRSYDNQLSNGGVLVQRPDFSDFAGRVTGDWYATAKTLLSVSAYQELGGAQDINASSVLKRGASVNGVWLMREKWRLSAGATFENRDFRGDPGTSLLPQRNDDTLGASLALSYAPIKPVSVDAGARAGRRDSNLSFEDYEFHSLFVSARADF